MNGEYGEPVKVFISSKNNPIPEINTNSIDISLNSSKTPFQSEAAQFFKVFFNFGYYLLLVPCRFSFNSLTGAYEIHSNKLQQFLIILNNIVTGIYFLLKLYTKYPEASNPTVYLELCYYFCDTLYLSIMFYIFGKKSHEMTAILEDIQKNYEDTSKSSTSYRKTRLFATVICILCIGSVFCAMMEAYSMAGWDISQTYLNFENDAINVFSGVYSKFNIKPVSSILAFLSFWSTMTERVLNAFSDILFTMIALTFQSLVQSFLQLLNKSDTVPAETVGSIYEFIATTLLTYICTCLDPRNVIKNYRTLKNWVQRLNITMSVITGSFIIGNLPFYVTNVFDIFADVNIFVKLRYLFYCSYYFPSLFLAAKSCREMEEMKTWLCQADRVRGIPFLELSLLLHEVNNQPVGLGPFGLQVNYNLVGSEVSIILTYALLKSQFSTN